MAKEKEKANSRAKLYPSTHERLKVRAARLSKPGKRVILADVVDALERNAPRDFKVD